MTARRWSSKSLVVLSVLALPAAALAEGTPQPDPLTLVGDGVRGAATAQTSADRRCPELFGGTAGLHEKDAQRALQEGLFAPVALPSGPGPAGLPARGDLRSLPGPFNRRYAFVLRDGHVYFRPVATTAWAKLPTPA